MKLNRTNMIFIFILMASFVIVGKVISASGHFFKRFEPSLLQAKSKMDFPLKAMVEESDRADEQKSLIEKPDSSLQMNEAPLMEMRPSDDKIKEQVSANAHQVPASLLDFSVVVADKMDQAKKNFVYAEALFSEFRQCAVSENQQAFQNLALRAYCLANAKRLVTWYPDLINQWNSLSSQISQQLMDLVDLTQG